MKNFIISVALFCAVLDIVVGLLRLACDCYVLTPNSVAWNVASNAAFIFAGATALARGE